MEEESRGTDFTARAWESLYDVVDNQYFQDQDAELIYNALEKRLKFIPFGEYLKRYIYRKAALDTPFDEVPLKLYQQIIRDSFAETGTPASFSPTTAKLSALSKNWLTQQTVKRSAVFLLGFGLSMSAADVNDFLKKALREQGINAKDPFEVICWYCYKNGYSYPKFEKLRQIYLDTPPNSLDMRRLYDDYTIGARNSMASLSSDAALIAFISKYKTGDNGTQQSVSARRCFDELYDRARDLVADIYNRTEEEEHGEAVSRYRAMLLDNDRIPDAERLMRVQKKREQQKVFCREDITESDLEHIISSAIPVDRHGNLTPAKASRLNAQFAGKRFSRQRIGDILSGKAEVSRFDLITLNFFLYSQTLDDYPNIKSRYVSFIETTNRLLERCFFGSLYIANPYECFVLMCILSEDPLGTYADVWEKSYEGAASEV